MRIEERIDKWLWKVRVYKTHTQATEEVRRGRVTIAGQPVKASRSVKAGDVIEVRKPGITYMYRVAGIPGGRLGAKLVPDYLKDITPPDRLEMLEMAMIGGFVSRQKGLGRPTKKDARDMADFVSGFDDSPSDFWDEEDEEAAQEEELDRP